MTVRYEAPRVTELGSFAELTLLTPKDIGVPSDGFSYQGQSLVVAS
ncbi:lasso RiPP family leader peptide-containing protein [Kineococcus sp. LSe6-4]|uniref:Lasso RiPP family leader peptide-containing protein n=1 Tax=Kineococcus halophytocola TaxID=3234027 RepID=A0ABV4H270_9ACTN